MLVTSTSTMAIGGPKELSCIAVPNLWDIQTDRQIEDLLNSAVFAHKAFQYSYDCQPWDIRIATNPANNLIALSDQMSMQFRYGIFTKHDLPEVLESHLTDLIEQNLQIKGGSYISCGTLNGIQAYNLLDHFKVVEDI